MQNDLQTQNKVWKATSATLAAAAVGLGAYAYQTTRAEAQTTAAAPSAAAPSAATTPPAVNADSPAIRDAAAMQSAFAQVARTAEPAVVTITTTVRPPRFTRQPRLPFGGNPFGNDPFGGSPFGFGDPFGDDPFGGLPPRRFRPNPQPNSASPEQRMSQGMFRPTQEAAGGIGSGFVYDRSGLIMTNAHVVRGASRVTVKLQDGREFKNARVLGADDRTDIAVIKVDGADLPVVPLGDSAKLNVGDWAIAVGNPFGFSNTLTVGVVSALAREVPSETRSPNDYIQTDASINPGNSGGPLLDIYGRVVGVNNSIWSPTGGNVGIGFAVPINTARQIADTLAREGRVVRAQLGVGIGDLGEDAAAFGLPAGTVGVIVGSVEPNGPASRAGLQPGDVITRFNGEAVVRAPDLSRRVSAAPVGQEATLTVLRGGRTLTLRARLTASPDSAAARPQAPTEPDRDPAGSGRLGVQIGELTPELARQLNAPAGLKGVVVGGVQPNSPAGLAGMRPGDIISRVGQADVATPDELRAALKRILDAQAGVEKKVALYVTRQGQSRFLVVTVPGS